MTQGITIFRETATTGIKAIEDEIDRVQQKMSKAPFHSGERRNLWEQYSELVRFLEWVKEMSNER